MIEKSVDEARQGGRGTHVFRILRISAIATAAALLLGALAAVFWNPSDQSDRPDVRAARPAQTQQ